jgi:DedD protein
MGLFSFLSKNKQDNSAEVSGHFSRSDDDAITDRARAKRASHAGGGARRSGAGDPVLPEKKRARRRLVGAVALALAAAVGLPMLMDSEPKQLAGDIAIEIPAKDKAGPLPMPAAPAKVAASDSVDKGEEIVPVPVPSPAAAGAPKAAAAPASRTVAEVQATAPKADAPKVDPVKTEPAKPEHKDKPAKAEPKPEAKEKPKAESKEKPARKEDKPAHAAPDAARAIAILEGKDAAKAHDAPGQKVVLQVAALGSQEKVAELQAKLRDAGIHSFTQKLQRTQGELIRVKVGPYSKEEAEKVRAQLSKLGLSGTPAPA